MRLHRPIGIWLLLWPTLWALWIAAAGRPDPKVFLILVLGTIVVRSAGCVINDFADRKIDPHVARTADRPLATGEVAPVEALLLFAALMLIALGLVLTLNTLTISFAVAGAAHHGDLPVHEALPVDAAVRARRRVRVGRADGVRRHDRRRAARSAGCCSWRP